VKNCSGRDSCGVSTGEAADSVGGELRMTFLTIGAATLTKVAQYRRQSAARTLFMQPSHVRRDATAVHEMAA